MADNHQSNKNISSYPVKDRDDLLPKSYYNAGMYRAHMMSHTFITFRAST